MAAITILKDNVPQGPFTRAEVADQLTRGEVTLDSLAFVDGLTQWTPLRDVLAKVDALHPPPPVVAALPVASGHAHIPAPETAALIGTGYSYAATMQPPEHLVYAGFWLRLGAYILDYVLLNILLALLAAFVGAFLRVFSLRGSPDADHPMIVALYLLFWLVLLVMNWLYYALQESGAAQATLGKRALHLLVTDRQGRRIGFGQATGRYFGKFISVFSIGIGFMMAGWTQRKQALHDMLADTLVVRKPGL